ncbi:MAG: hypothetical protein H6557_14535 [Lewinellaceae bacterium]|nr:hypothetical protein [Phaeodactylibacter sp.]MCB9037829.1 hypothetical protein [Lewinellaceae bacterium]
MPDFVVKLARRLAFAFASNQEVQRDDKLEAQPTNSVEEFKVTQQLEWGTGGKLRAKGEIDENGRMRTRRFKGEFVNGETIMVRRRGLFGGKSGLLDRDKFREDFDEDRIFSILGEEARLRLSQNTVRGFPLDANLNPAENDAHQTFWIRYRYVLNDTGTFDEVVSKPLPNDGRNLIFQKDWIFDSEHPDPSRASEFILSYPEKWTPANKDTIFNTALKGLRFIDEGELEEEMKQTFEDFLEMKREAINDAKFFILAGLKENAETEGFEIDIEEFDDDNLNRWLRDKLGFFDEVQERKTQ